MGEVDVIFDLSLALGMALLAGTLAQRLHQPPILGYLAAGMLIGPRTPVIGLQPERVEALAELGLLLLMFSLGIQFSLSELQRVRNVAVYGGIVQIILTAALGLALGLLLGFGTTTALFFGALIALSSTVVVVKVLLERGELDSTHGRIMLGICLVQDLSLVPLIVILPALAGPVGGLPQQLAVAALKAALVLAATYLLGTRLVPRVLFLVATTRSRELFLITIVFLALGTAAGVSAAGLSLALGAFLAGLVVSESEYSHQTLADVLPLRDLFAVLFFVSIGMLIDPIFLVYHLPLVGATVLAIIVGKFAIVGGVTRLFGYPLRTAVYAGSGLVQIGEFSFVLARIGASEGILPEEVYSLILAAALVTILLTPLSLRLAEPAFAFLSRIPGVTALLAEPAVAYLGRAEPALAGHAVILGYGDVGQTLSRVLRTRGFSHLIIDHDPHAIDLARSQGLPCIYGDGANAHVLAQANLPRARLLAVTLPDPIAARLAVGNARRLNPRLDIIVRAPSPSAMDLLRGSGAREVINPSLEVGIEMTRHALHRFGISSIETLAIVNHLRAEHYREEEGEGET